ncbi:unnamed protein product [Malus baccata var. baccata]
MIAARLSTLQQAEARQSTKVSTHLRAVCSSQECRLARFPARTPSNLAAATIFYVLTSDVPSMKFSCTAVTLQEGLSSFNIQGHDDHLLESPNCINFLIRFCKPIVSNTIEDKVPKVGRCKELKPSCADEGEMENPELCPKWIALDSIIFFIGWLKDSSHTIRENENDMVRSLVLLLKCLKIMENATFLSKENQSHLLGMKRKLDPMANPLSFTELVTSAINILSGLCLHKSSSSASNDKKSYSLSNGSEHVSEKSSNRCQSSQLMSTPRSVYTISSSETTSTSMTDTYSLNTRLNSSRNGSSNGASRHVSGGTRNFSNLSLKNAGLSQRSYNFEDSKIDLSEESQDPFAFIDGSRMDADLSQRSYISEDTKIDLSRECQDPFAFDEDDYKPSKWDMLSGKKIYLYRNRMQQHTEKLMTFHIMSQEASSNGENHQTQETSCSGAVSREGSSLVADCLLTAVKNNRHLSDQELDFLVAILGLLVNLVEKDGQNRSRLAAASVQVASSEGFGEESRKDLILLICSIFLENQGPDEGGGEEMVLPTDEAAVLQGEQEAEKMIIEAYSALLLAFLSTESIVVHILMQNLFAVLSKSIRDAISDCLPDRNLAILVPVLDRFVAFHLTLNMISPETHKAVSEVIESCRIRKKFVVYPTPRLSTGRDSAARRMQLTAGLVALYFFRFLFSFPPLASYVRLYPMVQENCDQSAFYVT